MNTRHEPIYRDVYILAWGEVQWELAACLLRHRRRGDAASTQHKLRYIVTINQLYPNWQFA